MPHFALLQYNNILFQNVEFSSNLIFELYNSSEIGLYIKVLYNGEYMPICSNGKTCMY
jgi:hypothetical protein